MKPILNIDELKFEPWGQGDRYEARRAAVAPHLGAQKLGYNVTVIAPGKSAFPAHSHRVNEEMFFVLEGDGELRVGEARYPVRRGDIVACPPGGPETAHQLTASTSSELRILAVSTRLSPDIAHYPDSGKFGVLGEFAGPDGKPQPVRFLGRLEESLSYWD